MFVSPSRVSLHILCTSAYMYVFIETHFQFTEFRSLGLKHSDRGILLCVSPEVGRRLSEAPAALRLAPCEEAVTLSLLSCLMKKIDGVCLPRVTDGPPSWVPV